MNRLRGARGPSNGFHINIQFWIACVVRQAWARLHLGVLNRRERILGLFEHADVLFGVDKITFSTTDTYGYFDYSNGEKKPCTKGLTCPTRLTLTNLK